MKSFLKEYFTFSRSQQIGVVTLLVLIVLTLILPKVYVYFRNQKVQPDISFADKFEPYQLKNERVYTDSLFEFDPNVASLEQLRKLGFSSKLANTLMKYRNAGGTFKQASDLSKIYNFPDSLYQRILPFIHISVTDDKLNDKRNLMSVNQHNEPTKIKCENIKNTEIFELNTVDSVQLVSIAGIGPVFAKRIINYRQFLGGFYNVNQLKEVYKFPEETFHKVVSQFKADSSLIVKIDLNKVEFKQLSKHPYLAYSQTKAILSYRKSMGKFKSTEELVRYKLVDTTTYYKIKHYLLIE